MTCCVCGCRFCPPCSPVLEVMGGTAGSAAVTAGPGAAPVAGGQGSAHRGGKHPGGEPDVQGLGGAVEDHVDDPGVAQRGQGGGRTGWCHRAGCRRRPVRPSGAPSIAAAGHTLAASRTAACRCSDGCGSSRTTTPSSYRSSNASGAMRTHVPAPQHLFSPTDTLKNGSPLCLWHVASQGICSVRIRLWTVMGSM